MKSRFVLLCSLAAYLIALGLPALHGGAKSLSGLTLLLLGWFQAVGGECFAWLANLLFFAGIALFFCKRYRATLIAALTASLVGLDTFRATRFSVDSAGYNTNIDHIGYAFYVWQLSFILLAITSALRSSANNSFKPKPLRGSA